MPVSEWYALENPPSIISSLPPALMGLSPLQVFTGTCPEMIWDFSDRVRKPKRIILHIFVSSKCL